MVKSKSPTPCIGVCSTGLGDSVCRGCKRYAHEVIQWNGYSDSERGYILIRIDGLLGNIVQNYLDITDPVRLRAQLGRHQIRFSEEAGDGVLAFKAISEFGGQLPDMEIIGCKLLPNYVAWSLGDIKQAIDKDFYELSCAHYERYFPEHT